MPTNFHNLKVEELKKELRARGAKVTGRKKELIERLENYERNQNFGYREVAEEEAMVTPEKLCYKDINSDSVVPILKNDNILAYLHENNYPEIIKKAQLMYERGYLKYIQCCDNFIKAEVGASMKKSVSYCVDVKVLKDSVECQCECPVGVYPSACCKHVQVVFLAIQDFHNVASIKLYSTCTQVLQTFHQPKRKHTSSPIPAHFLSSKKAKIPPVKVKDEMYNILFYQTVKNFTCSGNQMAFSQMFVPANPLPAIQDHDYLKNEPLHELFLKLRLISIEKELAQKIEEDTINQAENDAWKEWRLYRITGSKAGAVFRSTERASSLVQYLINIAPDIKTRAIAHGKKYESVAIEKYCSVTGNIAEKCGFFIDVDRPYVGASPDGLVAEHIVLEVKCPYVSRFRFINPITVPYLENNNGELCLKKKHDYYHQVQLQLHLTKRSYCHFIVYTFADIKIIIIPKDEDFIAEMLIKFEDFFNKQLRPAIINKLIEKNYDSLQKHFLKQKY